MDWTGEHLIRAPRRAPKPPPMPPYRVPDADEYAAAARAGMSMTEAAAHIGVSLVAVWKAAKRLGLTFRDGRRNA